MAEQRVCELTAAGIRAAKEYLAALRQDACAKSPAGLLADGRFARPIAPAVYVEQRSFANRREAGEYLNDRLSPLGAGRIASSAGLWSWLGMFYFEQVVNRYAYGRMRISASDVAYVIDPSSHRRGYSQTHRNRRSLPAGRRRPHSRTDGVGVARRDNSPRSGVCVRHFRRKPGG